MIVPSKFLPLLIAGVFALASLPALTSAWGYPSGDKRSGQHERMSRCDGKPRSAGMQHKHKRYGPERLAKKLSAAETEIGIRANQLDAWRDFTDALQGMMTRPSRQGWEWSTDHSKEEPFARAERLAERVITRGKAAEDLIKAIEALRGTLTPEQLTKVAAIEARMRQHNRRHSGPGPRRGAPEAPKHAPDTPDGDTEPAPEAQ